MNQQGTLARQDAAPGAFARSHAWERSAFLHERVAPPEGEVGAEALAEAGARAEAWRKGMLADAGTWRGRLGLAGTDEEGVARILAADPPGVREGSGALDWLAFVRGVETGAHADEPAPGIHDFRPDAPAGAFIPFYGFLRPFVQYALARLRRGMRDLGGGREPDSPPMSAEVERQVTAALLPRLGQQCSQTLTLELNVARLRGMLEGDTPEERFRFFSEAHLARTGNLVALLREYSPLGRLMVTTAERWADALLELLGRLEADRALIGEVFASGRDPGRIASLRTGVSDPHRGGRGVVHVRFETGLRLVYKPTPLAVDARFQGLVREVNGWGLRHPLRTIGVLDRGGYGWIEWVEAGGCGSDEEVRRFYRRQGSLLALLHTLRAADFHAENLIAAGEHPVPVDLEALFHHEFPEAEDGSAFDRTRRFLKGSVLRMAVLPLLIRTRAGGAGVDLSALGGRGGQTFAHSAHEMAHALTDRMHVVEKATTTSEAKNRPSLRGETVEATDYLEEIVGGFGETYDLLARNREALARSVQDFARMPVRNLVRMTYHYTLFLREGWHPDDLRDALDREILLDRLWAEATVRPALKRVVPSEAADLRLGDVPAFSALPGERHLWGSRGECIADFFGRDSLSDALETIRGMCDEERDRQAHLIRASFATVARPAAPPREDAPTRDLPSRGELLDAAVAVGEHLKRHAVLGDDDACWVGLDFETDASDAASPHRGLSPAHADLYEGVSGIAFFLAYLGEACGRDDFRSLALRALRGAGRAMSNPAAPGSGMVGAFLGRSAHVYLLLHLAALRRDSALLREALDELPLLEARLPGDRDLDLLGGAAGGVVVALELHRATGAPDALRIARLCGEHLLASAREVDGGLVWQGAAVTEPMCGFSHGAAGIAWALLRLADATGEARFRDAARRAIAWERGVFDPAGESWSHRQAAWCHGASSIALGRALAADLLPDPAFRAEVRAGAEAMLRRGMPADLCLCHGALGNADILLRLGVRENEPAWREAALRWGGAAAREVGALDRGGALPWFARSPGLMCGAAGVGMGLLRLADPDRIPSVLALEPPR